MILRDRHSASDPVRLCRAAQGQPRLLNMGPWATCRTGQPEPAEQSALGVAATADRLADALLYAEIADCRADPDLAARNNTLAMLVRAADEDGRDDDRASCA